MGKSSFTPAQYQDRIEARNNKIRTKIIPDLMADINGAFSHRIRKAFVEQKLIEFNIKKAHSEAELRDVVPDDTELKAQGEALSLFRIAPRRRQTELEGIQGAIACDRKC